MPVGYLFRAATFSNLESYLLVEPKIRGNWSSFSTKVRLGCGKYIVPLSLFISLLLGNLSLQLLPVLEKNLLSAIELGHIIRILSQFVTFYVTSFKNERISKIL